MTIKKKTNGAVAIRRSTGERGGPGISVRTDRVRKALLELVAEGKSFQRAARQVGISRNALWNWRKDDPEFERELMLAYEGGTEKLEDYAYERATIGEEVPVTYMGKPVLDKKGNVITRRVVDNSLLEFQIKQRRGLIGTQKVQVSGPNGGPIPLLAMSLDDVKKEVTRMGLLPSDIIDL